MIFSGRWIPALVLAVVLAVAGCSGGGQHEEKGEAASSGAREPTPSTTDSTAGASTGALSPSAEGEMPAGAADEEAAAVLRRAMQALHAGDKAREQVIVGHAVCTGPNGDFTVDLSSAPDGRLWFRQKYPGRQPYVAMFTAQGSFTVDKDGTRGEMGLRDQLMVRSHDFQRIALQPGVFADRLVIAGKELYHGTVCVKLQGLTSDDNPVDFLFGEEDGRPRGFRIANSMSPGQYVDIFYREWATVEGVDLPSVIVASDEQGEFVFQFHALSFEPLLPPPGEEASGE